jgi:hypothetical protein
LLVADCGSRSAAQPAPPLRLLPLVVHVVDVDGKPVAGAEFVQERLERANVIFAPYRVGFLLEQRLPLPAAHAHLETRADRDALAKYVHKHVIDWFVVESLRDVDEPERIRRGVHWHARESAAHYVILSTLGGPDVLAHELGHYLGNAEHSPTPGNLMSYERGNVPPFLDVTQLARMERALRNYFGSGELRRARPAAAAVSR